MIYILLILCLLLSACGKKEEKTEEASKTVENVPSTDQQSSQEVTIESYLEEVSLLETPIREYGEEAGYVQLEGDLVVRILYPEGEITDLNKEIVDWVNETVAYYQEESIGAMEEGETAELTAEYESYVVNDKIVSIKISGYYESACLAHPVDIIATFHADINTGKLLNLEEVILSDGKDILREKVITDANIEENAVDEHLLDFWTLKNEGLEIILEQGDYLPMSEGTVTLLYEYDKIADIFSFESEMNHESSLAEESTKVRATEGEIEESLENTDISVIDSEKPMIALTFDDGPSKHTWRLLDIFTTYGGKGTFFVVGNLLDGRNDVVQRMSLDGHEIAGHSWDHRQLTKLSSEDLTDQLMTTRAKIYEITGVDTTLLRPPYGSYNDQTKIVCKNLGICMVNWSLDTLDWKYKDADKIYNTIMSEVKDGDIILCHDLHGTTVDAMERVIPDLIAKGYQLVTVTELLSYGKEEISAGSVYNKVSSH